jgi:hypothetical protein
MQDVQVSCGGNQLSVVVFTDIVELTPLPAHVRDPSSDIYAG